MGLVFWIAAVVGVLATFMVITRLNAVHALLYLIVSLLSVAVMFFTLGAPFIAALEVIIYAGAIMVLFVFVLMMLNIGPEAIEQEKRCLTSGMWWGPSILSAALLAEMGYVLFSHGHSGDEAGTVEAKEVSLSLFGPYLIGVELAGFLLLAALVGAFHLGRQNRPAEEGSR